VLPCTPVTESFKHQSDWTTPVLSPTMASLCCQRKLKAHILDLILQALVLAAADVLSPGLYIALILHAAATLAWCVLLGCLSLLSHLGHLYPSILSSQLRGTFLGLFP
jgi:hypothetical protein